MQIEVRTVVFVVFVVRDFLRELLVQHSASLVRPASCDITDSVSATPENEERHVERLHVVHACSMALEGQIEATEPITSERISATLENHSAWLEGFHYLGHDRFENALIALIIDPVHKWEVDRVLLTLVHPNVLHSSGAREILPIFVKRGRHDSVRVVKSLFHPIPMVDVDVDVEHPRIVVEQLEDCQNNIIDVAKARRL
mmetsp:Transcript_26272/g.36667  ORF Transcript_26272/g.36667 Transcript_26272/m.36667 type:complete len:200 (+) Transcript_26272:460-1059(+)